MSTSPAALAARQVRFVNKAFWRNPASAFFTFVFPLMFLVIFTALLGDGQIEVGNPPTMVSTATYYVASMAAFAVISACYTNIAISVSFQRDDGILKRIRGTPIPGAAFLSARVMHALCIAIILVVITTAFGAAFYGADVPTGITLVRFAAILLVGAASFTALGLACTTIIPNADAAPPIVNATMLPLLFLSGVFLPITPSTPQWIVWIGKIFPVSHFVNGFVAGYTGAPFKWSDVLIVAAWGVFGLLIAIRFFTWEPKR